MFHLTIDAVIVVLIQYALFVLYRVLGVHVLTQDWAIAVGHLILLTSYNLRIREDWSCEQTSPNEVVEYIAFIGHLSGTDWSRAVEGT